MSEPILCLVCLCLLAWVVLLKLEVDELKRALRRLRDVLGSKLKIDSEAVGITGGRPMTQSELKKIDDRTRR